MNTAKALKKKGPLDLYGTGEIDPSFRPQPEEMPGFSGTEEGGKEAKAPGTDWKGYLGAGLMGAAAGIQANVGPAKPGASLAQGIMKGVIGGSLVSSAMAEREAKIAARDAAYQEKKNLIDYKESKRPSADSLIDAAVRKQDALLPGKIKIAEAGARIKTATQQKIEDAQKGMTDAEIARINQQVGEQTDAYFKAKNAKKFNAPEPTTQEWNDKNEELRLNAFAGRPKPIKRPVLED